MNFENLKNKLDKGYLKISEYFNDSFDIFKYFLKEEKKFVLFFFVSYLILQFILPCMKYMQLEINDFIIMFIFLLQIFINSIGIQKIGNLIEANGKKISFFKTLKRFLFFFIWLIGITFLLDFIIILTKIQLLGIVLALFFIFNSLFFIHLVFLRDLNFIQTLKYNFHLCKGNRLRILLPSIIFLVFFSFILLPISFIYGLTANIQTLGLIFRIILTFFSSIFNLILIDLTTLIFLNVLYMDLKNIEEEKSIS
ncbi:hypothetical protein [Leptotrichia sp. oral taxon 847]|uniref:hypothetical protein n=1 Tax=Leptotrichia sp. oral taxon 847 TaxID=1785996 RepID=UPI000768161D|nr:hypothetical protein [Leptotrichia sp. oral taxon 847]AMD94170.1 hypothetical protein AXF11_00230 [Leptotrichia sp. oral taxon 847]